LKNIFKFNNEGLSDSGTIVGEFVLQEYIPEVLSKIKNTGNNDLNDMFIFKKNKKNK
jgi:hypothetical protein